MDVIVEYCLVILWNIKFNKCCEATVVSREACLLMEIFHISIGLEIKCSNCMLWVLL